MSLLKSIISKKFLPHGPLYVSIRNHGWNKDFKPGPYPATLEARNAAAKKYNMLPSEYDAYPEDGTGVGDYPKFPAVSGDSKDPNYPWDNPEFKRNYGETFHLQADMIGEDRYDVTMRHRVPFWSQWGQFLGVVFGLFGVMLVFENFKMFPALLPKQYPGDGEHYTFEIKND